MFGVQWLKYCIQYHFVRSFACIKNQTSPDWHYNILRPNLAPVDENKAVKVNPTIQAQTKDDAYETFMKEMEGLLWAGDG